MCMHACVCVSFFVFVFSSLMFSRWVKDGKKWVVFFQDTNGLVFRSVPAALGVSAAKNLSVNSFTVPRRPGEAVGAICRLEGNVLEVSLTNHRIF